MRLRKLELKNFRNYAQQVFEPCGSLNIISGDNAQGKTNILEAIYLTCTGKSFRSLRDTEMISWDNEFSLISAFYETAGHEMELRLLLEGGQKKIKINGAPSKGLPFGWPGIVLFTPDDLNIVKGSPQTRRYFFDTEIGVLDNQYSHYLNRYQRILQQRNNLLKETREGKKDQELMDTWNKQFSVYGAKIIKTRMVLLKKVNYFVRTIYRQLTGGKEEISFRYSSSIKIEQEMEEKEIINLFNRVINEVEKDEIYRGQSLIGPHRDDIIFFINGKETRIYGSQGQQRSLILAFKLALLKMWYNEAREYPILLLDDVMSELDEIRQKELLKIISNDVQTFISSSIFTDINTAAELIKMNFVVKEGTII